GVAHTTYNGCLGTREERIYLFQRYIAEKCGVPTTKTMSLQEECDYFKELENAPREERAEEVAEESTT
ncbi:MAG: hypothetical protein CMJ46_13750, partial [Planctomyces sp.]|nr:hypothetical protein [Planctomyces sp.]